MKKNVVALIVFILLTGTLQINNVKAVADVTNPTLESIQVDKTEATVGDTVKVSVKATDDVGISRVRLYYKTPITNKSVYVSMNYNPTTGMYEGSIPIQSNSESGTYKVNYVTIYDSSENQISVWDWDGPDNKLSGGEFTVTGTTEADITKPTLESIQVDKSKATINDTVKVSVKATDDVGISRVRLYYKTPITNKSVYVSMNYNPTRGMYEGSIPIQSNSESGTYKVSYV
ncbi:hypothetical protein, partial [Terrilactibacillus laevilacticus]